MRLTLCGQQQWPGVMIFPILLQMERLQHANRELKQRNATLESMVKHQQYEQHATEKEMRAQQLAHTRTINHLFDDHENKALRAANRNRRHLDDNAGFAGSDQ